MILLSRFVPAPYEHVIGDFEDPAVHLDDDSLAIFAEVGIGDGVV